MMRRADIEGEAGRAEATAEPWEYLTYAPAGALCTTCRRAVGALEPVRRRDARQDGSGVPAYYRHAAECPRSATDGKHAGPPQDKPWTPPSQPSSPDGSRPSQPSAPPSSPPGKK